MIPNLFIVGAPKCGTTSLYSWLEQHPDVFVSPKKEPHYFYTPYKRRPKSLKKYLAWFKNAQVSHKVIAEASVWYMYSRTAIDRVLEFNPMAKFIICLRNPVSMFPSLHAQQIFAGLEGEYDIERAWALSEARSAGSFEGIKKIVGKVDPGHMAYKDACMLGAQVSDLIQKTDPARVKFVLLDDMHRDQVGFFADICDFLDIPDISETIDFVVMNKGDKQTSVRLGRAIDQVENTKGLRAIFPQRVLNRLRVYNQKHVVRQPLRPEFKQELQDYFTRLNFRGECWLKKKM